MVAGEFAIPMVHGLPWKGSQPVAETITTVVLCAKLVNFYYQSSCQTVDGGRVTCLANIRHEQFMYSFLYTKCSTEQNGCLNDHYDFFFGTYK